MCTLTPFEERIRENTEGLSAVSTGICSGCEECRSEYADGMTSEEFDDAISSGQIPNEPFFSWHGCELCGSPLAGGFEPWHAVDDETGEFFHGERACVDCIMYLANGVLPESAE